MVAKEILSADRARAEISAGVNALADAVKITLGPRGRNAMLARGRGSPLVTKDGAMVANEIELRDRFANMGAQMVKEVAAKTAEVAGDGTTTATVLAQSIFVEGCKLVAAGIDPMEIKRGIDAAVGAAVDSLRSLSKPTRGRRDIARVGTISTNGDEAIGELIAEAMETVGPEGVITVEDAESIETTVEFVAGMEFERGFLSAYFVTEASRMEVTLSYPYVLLLDEKMSDMNELVPLLEAVAKSKKPLLLIAEDVTGDALATLVLNHLRGTLQVCAVKAPGFGSRRREVLEDIAVLTGGRTVSRDTGLKVENLTLNDLGRAEKIIVDKKTTKLIGGAGELGEIKKRGAAIHRQIAKCDSDSDRKVLQQRLARLVGGVAILKVGAVTELALREKKARVEDALRATRAAAEEGIVPGGGVALLRALPALETLALVGGQQHGVDVVRRALEEPLRQIASNAGAEGAVVVQRVRASLGGNGYNAASGQYEDLMAAGVIDPTKVVRVALQNAASVASVMLTTEVAIAQSVGDRTARK